MEMRGQGGQNGAGGADGQGAYREPIFDVAQLAHDGAPIRALRTFLGTMASPWTGWLLLRSLETLKMRMTASMKNARYVADFLRDHPRVRKVHYLGHLESDHPLYEVYRRQCTAPGSLIAFEVEDGEAGAFRFLNSLRLVKLAVSLGGTESLAEHPCSMTHADVPAEAKERFGITAGLVPITSSNPRPVKALIVGPCPLAQARMKAVSIVSIWAARSAMMAGLIQERGWDARWGRSKGKGRRGVNPRRRSGSASPTRRPACTGSSHCIPIAGAIARLCSAVWQGAGAE